MVLYTTLRRMIYNFVQLVTTHVAMAPRFREVSVNMQGLRFKRAKGIYSIDRYKIGGQKEYITVIALRQSVSQSTYLIKCPTKKVLTRHSYHVFFGQTLELLLKREKLFFEKSSLRSKKCKMPLARQLSFTHPFGFPSVECSGNTSTSPLLSLGKKTCTTHGHNARGIYC